MAAAVEVKVKLIDGLSPKLGKMQRNFMKLSNSIEKSEAKLKKFGNAAKSAGQKMSAFVSLPILAAGGASLKLASDAEETANKFGEVFKGIEKEGADAVGGLSRDFKLAASTSQELLSNTGDLLTGLGLSKKEALSLSESVVRLSGDVASFKNVQGGTQRAAESLTKALLGEREMLKETFKTAVLEAEVQERAADIMAERVDLTEQQAKALATLAIVTERNKAAVGDFNRTQHQLANQFRIFQEQIKGVAEKLGKVLIPVAQKVLIVISRILTFMDKLPDSVNTIIVVMAGIAAAIGPILIGVGQLAIAVTMLKTSVLVAAKAMLVALLPLLPKILLIGAAIAFVAFLVWKFWKPIKTFLLGFWDGFIEGMQPIFEEVKAIWEAMKPLLDILFELLGVQSETGEGFKEIGRIVGQMAAFMVKTMAVPLRMLGQVVKLSLKAGAFLADKLGIGPEGGDAARGGAVAAAAAVTASPIVAPAQAPVVNNNIQISSNVDASTGATEASVMSDSTGRTKVDTVETGQITPRIF